MYRVIDSSLWSDPKIRPLLEDGHSDAVLLFIYLFSNPSAHLSGVYRITSGTICDDLAFTSQKVGSLLRQIESYGLIKYDYAMKTVYVRGLFRHQGSNESCRKSAASHFNSLHRCPLIKAFLKDYPDVVPFITDDALLEEDPIQIGVFDSLETESLHPVDTLSTPQATKEKKQDKDKDKKYTSAESEAFIRFWSEYPDALWKVNRKAAWKIWSRDRLDSKVEWIIKSLKVQKRQIGWLKDNGDFIPKPENYLLNGGWVESDEALSKIKTVPNAVTGFATDKDVASSESAKSLFGENK